jgi:hypothetical protein
MRSVGAGIFQTWAMSVLIEIRQRQERLLRGEAKTDDKTSDENRRSDCSDILKNAENSRKVK